MILIGIGVCFRVFSFIVFLEIIYIEMKKITMERVEKWCFWFALQGLVGVWIYYNIWISILNFDVFFVKFNRDAKFTGNPDFFFTNYVIMNVKFNFGWKPKK